MESYKIREPIQKRSIEKKEKIIKAGFDLICQKGYHNTNTAEIAKASGVSTGIVYNYFKDKKDIFMEGIQKYANSILFPMLDILTIEPIKKEDLENFLRRMIAVFINTHTISKSAHEELISMSHTDADISALFLQAELEMTEKIVEILKTNHFDTDNLEEKVHISMGLIENLCHEIVYHQHKDMNYDAMTNIVIKIVVDLLV